MKFVLVLLVATLAAFASAAPKEEEKYTTQYDTIDYEGIIKSPRLLDSYQKCLIGKGPCTKEGTTLKEHIPDALATDCSKCSDKQKEAIKHILLHLYKNEEEKFKEIENIYDKDGIYRKKLVEYAKKEKLID